MSGDKVRAPGRVQEGAGLGGQELTSQEAARTEVLTGGFLFSSTEALTLPCKWGWRAAVPRSPTAEVLGSSVCRVVQLSDAGRVASPHVLGTSHGDLHPVTLPTSQDASPFCTDGMLRPRQDSGVGPRAQLEAVWSHAWVCGLPAGCPRWPVPGGSLAHARS